MKSRDLSCFYFCFLVSREDQRVSVSEREERADGDRYGKRLEEGGKK